MKVTFSYRKCLKVKVFMCFCRWWSLLSSSDSDFLCFLPATSQWRIQTKTASCAGLLFLVTKNDLLIYLFIYLLSSWSWPKALRQLWVQIPTNSNTKRQYYYLTSELLPHLQLIGLGFHEVLLPGRCTDQYILLSVPLSSTMLCLPVAAMRWQSDWG